MKRKDAFSKLRTICQRLDEVAPEDFGLRPLRLYLFGSLLTDKPDPKDLDLVLVYEFNPGFEFEQLYADMIHGRSTVVDRLRMQLRRGGGAGEGVRVGAAWGGQWAGDGPRLIWMKG